MLVCLLCSAEDGSVRRGAQRAVWEKHVRFCSSAVGAFAACELAKYLFRAHDERLLVLRLLLRHSPFCTVRDPESLQKRRGTENSHETRAISSAERLARVCYRWHGRRRSSRSQAKKSSRRAVARQGACYQAPTRARDGPLEHHWPLPKGPNNMVAVNN